MGREFLHTIIPISHVRKAQSYITRVDCITFRGAPAKSLFCCRVHILSGGIILRCNLVDSEESTFSRRNYLSVCKEEVFAAVESSFGWNKFERFLEYFTT